jgi:hypothetical protein
MNKKFPKNSLLERATLRFLISKMDSNNIASVGNLQRISFAEKQKTSVLCISRAIYALKSKGLVKPVSRNEYIINIGNANK